MATDDFFEGTALTGRQAALIFLTFLSLIIIAGLLLILFSDFFRNLVMSANAAGDPVGVATLAAAQLVCGVER